MLRKRRGLYRAIRRRSYDKYSQSRNNDRASRPTHSGNRRYPLGSQEGRKRAPHDLRPYFVTGSNDVRAYSFRTCSKQKSGVPVGTAIAREKHAEISPRERWERRCETAKNPRGSIRQENGVEKCRDRSSGQNGVFTRFWRPLPSPPTIASTTTSRTRTSVRRWYFGGESFLEGGRGKWRQKKKKKKEKRARRRVSRFEVRDPAHRLLSATSLVLRWSLRLPRPAPICRLRDERNKVYSFWGSQVSLSPFRFFSLLLADRCAVKRFSRSCKKRD